VAVLILLAASARAGIIGIDLLLHPSLGLLHGCIVLVGAGHLGDLFSLYFLLYFLYYPKYRITSKTGKNGSLKWIFFDF
jgi:hypothetical protein